MKKFLLVLGIVSFFILTISLLTSSCKVAEGMETVDLDKSISSALSQIDNLPGNKGSSSMGTAPSSGVAAPQPVGLNTASMAEKAVTAPQPVGMKSASMGDSTAVTAPQPVGMNTASPEKASMSTAPSVPQPVGMKSASMGDSTAVTAPSVPQPVGLNTTSMAEKAVTAPSVPQPVGLNTSSPEKASIGTAPQPVGINAPSGGMSAEKMPAGKESFVPCMESTKFNPIQYY